MPVFSRESQRYRRDLPAFGVLYEKRQMRRSRLALQPQRTLILHAGIEEHAPSPNGRAAIIGAEAHAFGAILEFDVRELNLATFCE